MDDGPSPLQASAQIRKLSSCGRPEQAEMYMKSKCLHERTTEFVGCQMVLMHCSYLCGGVILIDSLKQMLGLGLA